MKSAVLVRTARTALRERLTTLVGPSEVPRFEEALTHPSFANESRAPDNQRLEFLGDAVLGLCVSELLTEAFPEANEGLLTRMRSALVNAEALARWGRAEGLGACLSFGRGAEAGSEREQTNVLADAVEALVAAVYVALGLDGARKLVRDVVAEPLRVAEGLGSLDPKSALQEQVQAAGSPSPGYRVVGNSGSSHEPLFEVEVLVGDEVRGRGKGRSKRLAERAAADDALRAMANPEPPNEPQPT